MPRAARGDARPRTARQPPCAADPGERIFVDVQKFRAYLAGYEHDVRTFTREFRRHAVLELSYEDMASNTRGAFDAVLGFLGVKRRPLRPQTGRQSTGNVVTHIANLDEVAAAHRGTRWEHVPDQW